MTVEPTQWPRQAIVRWDCKRKEADGYFINATDGVDGPVLHAGKRLPLANCLPPRLPSTPRLSPGRSPPAPTSASWWMPQSFCSPPCSAPTSAPAWPPAPVSSPLPMLLLPPPAAQYAGEWTNFLDVSGCSLVGNTCCWNVPAASKFSLRDFTFWDVFKTFYSTLPHLILSTLSILSQHVIVPADSKDSKVKTLSFLWKKNILTRGNFRIILFQT